MHASISPQDVRRPAVAGSWYTDDPADLRTELEEYLAQAQDLQLEGLTGLISPHAGYVFSGPVAAWAYRQVQGRSYNVVVVVAPSHADAFPFAAVYGRGGYQTPLGLVPVDTALARAIAGDHSLVKISDRGHRQESRGRQEHSLEIQLPFLQVALGDFKLVPVIMGDQTEAVCHDLAEALAAALKGRNALLVASSDLSHFHPYDEANRLDARVARRVEDFDASGLMQDLAGNRVEACGGGPMCAVMEACRKLGATQSKVLKTANSGDVPVGGRDRVVGYLAAALYQGPAPEQTAVPRREPDETVQLSPQDRATLLQIARTTIESVVKGDAPPPFDVASPGLLEDRGAFVTIHEAGQLRGCIGYIVGIKPLYQTVCEVAASAALRDPRFEPVQPRELPHLELEISALTVPRRISNVDEIQVGVHGIIIRKGYRQGLLLPQVAAEYGWDRDTFLAQTCRKAGLPSNAWQDPDTEIEIFSAEVFGEE
ncbi:MAG: AmmeMemoRadiSam system protein B [Candidatus Zixiibacteriota bacterium]|nr:MAG: AmmeMemoRadiSam system protein B [candidate division Zixibacteria bacterium]